MGKTLERFINNNNCYYLIIFTEFFYLGLQIFSSPFSYVHADPDFVSTQRKSLSSLEFIDILYAGYDGFKLNFF